VNKQISNIFGWSAPQLISLKLISSSICHDLTCNRSLSSPVNPISSVSEWNVLRFINCFDSYLLSELFHSNSCGLRTAVEIFVDLIEIRDVARAFHLHRPFWRAWADQSFFPYCTFPFLVWRFKNSNFIKLNALNQLSMNGLLEALLVYGRWWPWCSQQA